MVASNVLRLDGRAHKRGTHRSGYNGPSRSNGFSLQPFPKKIDVDCIRLEDPQRHQLRRQTAHRLCNPFIVQAVFAAFYQKLELAFRNRQARFEKPGV